MSNVYLAHYGIPNQKWGVRRFQNEDGSLTPAGRERYGIGPERASKKYSKAGMVGLEAKYQAKRAVKSAKKTASDLSRQRRESVAASKQRRRQSKIERAERKEQIRKEKAEDLARKIAARESKKSLSDLKEEFDEARMNDARRRVAALLDKRERIQEKAFLKEQEKALKKDMKNAKKDAEREAKSRFSKKKIRSLTDEEVQDRIDRLKKEAELVGLEAKRNHPAMAYVGNKLLEAGGEAAKGLVKDTITTYGKKWLGLDASDKSKDTPKSRADKIREQLDELKAQKEYNDWVSGRNQNDADEELAREAKRYQNLQTIANAKKNINPNQGVDEYIERKAKRLQNLQTIENATRTITGRQSAEDSGKMQSQQITARKEMERRAEKYRSQKNADGSYKFTIAEIADRLGVDEDDVRRYLYE